MIISVSPTRFSAKRRKTSGDCEMAMLRRAIAAARSALPTAVRANLRGCRLRSAVA